MIIIHAGFQIKPDEEAAFLTEIRSLIQESRSESGNISYDLMKDTEHDHAYTMVEVWKDAEAVGSHNASDHFQAFVSKAPQYLSAPLSIKSFEGNERSN